MEIIKLKISELTPYKNNAKEHPKEQIEQIKKSIHDFGNNDPIAIWGENNIIVEGHGRYIALQELGFDEVECIRLDHLTEEERKAYTLVHNQLTMNTGWNDLLEIELEDLNNLDFDMEQFGFEFNVDDFDETELDKEPDKENKPQIQITFNSYEEYERCEDELKEIAESNGGELVVRMV